MLSSIIWAHLKNRWKKWKDLRFAAGANRDEITHSAQELGIDLWEHVGNVIEAMRVAAGELGLIGNIESD